MWRFVTEITLSVLTCFFASDTMAAGNAKILAFGDSLTAGYRVESLESYPAQLEKLFRDSKISVEIHNAGVSGDTSRQALLRVDWALKRGPYDYVLLGIGANDGLRNLPIETFESNLRKLVERFQREQIRVVLLGMKLPTNYNPDYRKKFENVYRTVAHEKKLLFYPFFLEGVAAEEKLNQEDAIHPNPQGYKKISQRLFDFLKGKIH